MSKFLDRSNLKLAAYFSLGECFLKHKKSLREREGVVVIHSSKKLLEIADLEGKERRKVNFN